MSFLQLSEQQLAQKHKCRVKSVGCVECFMQPYKSLIHGGDVVSAAERCPGGEILDFSANISPLGLPLSVRGAVVDGLDQCVSYPDPLCRALRAALAEYEGLPAHWILCGAGADDLIFRLAWGLRPQKALLLAPTFSEYELALRQVGCRCVYHTLREEEGFAPRPSLAEEAAGCDLALLCNPNNPTGLLIDPGLMERVLAACVKSGAVLAVDECFLDFLQQEEHHTLKRRLKEYDRLIIIRAFTKIFALPGLRLGYALCAGGELLRKMDEAGPAWNVAIPAQLAGIAAAGERAYREEVRALILREREYLMPALRELGLRVYPGAVNFLLFYTDRADLAESMANKGVLIRDCSNYRGLGPGYYRVAVRGAEENAALVNALKECLK